MPVSVRWGTDRFEFNLPRPDTQVAALRQSIAAYTGLQLAAFHIVHDGAVLADDNQPISAYHLRANSTLHVVALADSPQRLSQSESAVIATIAAEVATVHSTLEPAHARFLADLAALPNPKTTLVKEHRRVSELLLQALLRVDGIVTEHDWTTARADRKAAVRLVQSLLDQLDSAWANTHN